MKRNEDYPDFTGFIEALDRDGIGAYQQTYGKACNKSLAYKELVREI